MKAVKKFGKPPCLFKADISVYRYKQLLHTFERDDVKEMLYLYFDTELCPKKAKLFNAKVSLRVRLKNDEHNLEYKNRTSKPYEEISQPISLSEFNSMFQSTLPNGMIKNRLLDLNLPAKQLILVNTAYTTRAKKFFYGGVLVLDKTICGQKERYQIEFRSRQLISEIKLSMIKKRLRVPSHFSYLEKIGRVWEHQS